MEDYKALVKKARRENGNEPLRAPHALIDSLADAVEALLAEEQYQRRTKEAALGGLGRYEKRLQKVEAERRDMEARVVELEAVIQNGGE